MKAPSTIRVHPRANLSLVAEAFTLLELLVSISVLTMLLLAVTQMVNGTISVTAGSTRHLDADRQARLVFDRMAVDFAQIVKRPDVDYYFQKSIGDDQMAFYSETTGYFSDTVTGPGPKSNASLIGYRVYKPSADAENPAAKPQFRRLERLSKALVWNGVTTSSDGITAPSGGSQPNLQGMIFWPQTLPSAWPGILLPDPATANSSSGAIANPNPYYQTLGDSVFRMEICFLMAGNAGSQPRLSVTPYLPKSTPATTVPVSPYNSLRDVIAVVVSLAILDETSRLTIQPSDLDATAARLEDVTADSFPASTEAQQLQTPAQIWQAHITQNDLSTKTGGNLPQSSAAQVRFYERFFYLGNTR